LLYGAGSAQYWVFQIFATTLNALVCLPFALLLRTVGGIGRRAALVVATAVTAMLPFNFWNNTFTWTKELTAAFILPGIHEYLVAYREGNRNGMAMSLAYLAPGFLCHYLTLPYAAMPGLHLVLTVPIRALPFRALVRAGLISKNREPVGIQRLALRCVFDLSGHDRRSERQREPLPLFKNGRTDGDVG
jgi:hypothetical protein